MWACEEKRCCKFLGFFFFFFFCLFVCFIYPRLGVADAGNLDSPMDTDKRSPNKSLLYLKGQESGRIAWQRTCRQQLLYSHQIPQKKTGSHPTHATRGQVKSPDFYTHVTVIGHHNTLPGWCQRKPSREMTFSFPLASNKPPPSPLPAFQWSPYGESGLPHPLRSKSTPYFYS